MPYRTLLVTSKPQPLYVGQPLNKTTQLAVGWTLANNDQTNPVYVSTNPAVKSTDTDAILVAPLGSIPVDPTFTSYIVSAGPNVQCFLMPGGGTWAPSPAQVAAQINALGLMKDTTGSAINTNVTGVAKDASITPLAKDATVTGVAKDATLVTQNTAIPNNIAATGVPLLTSSTLIAQITGQSIATGATFTVVTTAAMTKPTYEVWVGARGFLTETTPFFTIELKWTDTASSQVISTQDYHLGAGGNSNNQYHGIGPIHADKLTVTVKNLGTTQAMTLDIVVLNNSTPALFELWKNEVYTLVNSFSAGDRLLFSSYIHGNATTIATGANVIDMLPLYTGLPMTISASTASNTTDLEYRIVIPPTLAAAIGLNAFSGGDNLAIWNSDAKGFIYQTWSAPRMMLTRQMINHNAAGKLCADFIAGTV